jgi:hypothetical protein
MKKLIYSLHVFLMGFLTNSVIHDPHFYNSTILFCVSLAFFIIVFTSTNKRSPL